MRGESNFDSIVTGFMQAAELEKKFPKEVVQEIKSFSKDIFAKSKERKDREDFRGTHIICIDPLGAKDHDDAISVEKTVNGYQLGVHIADVSHFVRPGSALDKEAQKRGYTQYLPWTAVPMLPDILSSDLCSLHEDEERFSFSCIIHLNKKFVVQKYRFVKGIIKVTHSLTYEEAKELFEKQDSDICLLAQVAEGLKKLREESGLLEMGSTEYKCKFNKKGLPQSIVPRTVDISNSWVEECMLAANRCCALELQKRKLNGVYRIHEAPSLENLNELIKDEPTLFANSPIDANKLLKEYKGADSQDKQIFDLYKYLVKKAKNNPLLINRILRSMQKARYSDECSGHFALHWKDYAHFTSPIRRYADLWCHRELSGGKKTAMKDLCSTINEAEIKNQKNERKALKICASYILKSEVGSTFKGEIQDIEEFGIFISISSKKVALADGLVHLRDIPGDYFEYNESKKALIGKRSKKIYKRGDKLIVKLLKANPSKGENDFEIVDKNAKKDKKETKNNPWDKAKTTTKNDKLKKDKKRRFGRK